jgi:cell division protein FtsW (lipid II flippase)
MVSGTSLAGMSFFLSLFLINPETTTQFGFILWYLSLFLFLLGTITLILIGLRSFILREERNISHVIIALRQAFWISLGVIVSLLLLAKDLFTWWNTLILCTILFLVEFIFLSQTKTKQ